MRLLRLYIGIIFICLFIGAGCEDRNNEKISIQNLISYAEDYEPCTPDGDCRKLYNTPKEIRSILEDHAITQEYIKSVMLVLLKHYVYEFSNFHQGYELRNPMYQRQSAFVSAYMKITGGYHGDYMTARVAYDWVKNNPEYMKEELIADQINKIEEVEKEIENISH